MHVSFRRKFPNLIKLKELQRYAKDGGILQQMQTLRQSRLSVSKVTRKEWEFVMSLVEDDEADADYKQRPPAPVAPMKEKTVADRQGSAIGQPSATDRLTSEISQVASEATETLTNGLNAIRGVFEPAPDVPQPH